MTTKNHLTPVPDIGDGDVFQTSGDQYEVSIGLNIRGENVEAIIAADTAADGPSIYLIMPPTGTAPDHGYAYELTEDDAIDLAEAIYESLSPAAKARFLTTNHETKEARNGQDH